MPPIRTESPLSRFLVWPLLLGPIVLLALLFARYVVNMPYQDDFDALTGPVAALSRGPGFWKSLHILYVQDDERRIIFDRLMAYVVYRVNGTFDHRLLIAFGCLSLPGLWVLFARTLRKMHYGWWAVLPVTLVLFQPRYYETVLWSMLPTQHFAVYFFALWTFYLLAKPQRWAFGAAIFTVLIAICADSNGSFAWAIGIVIVGYQQRYRRLLVWMAALLPVIFLYYYQLEIPAYRPKLSDNLLKLPGVVVHEFFSFLGIPADPGPRFPLPVRIGVTAAVGVPLFLAAAWWLLGLLSRYPLRRWPHWLHRPAATYRRYPEPVAFLTGAALLLLLTMLAYATARAGDGIAPIFVSRYKLIACLVVLVAYGLTLATVPNRWRNRAVGLFTGIGLLFFTSGYFQYFEGLVNFRRALLVDAYSWQHTRTLPSSPIYLSFRDAVDAFVLDALAARTYRFPEGIYTGLRDLARRDTTTRQTLAVQFSPDSVYLHVRDETFARGPGRDDGAYTVLHGDSLTYLFPTVQHRYGLRLALTHFRYFANGYDTAPILLLSLRPGTYRVGTLVVTGNHRRVEYSRWTLDKKATGVRLVSRPVVP